MNRSQRTRTIGLVVALTLITASCAKAPSSLTPVGVKYYQANRGVVAAGTLQHVAIELNKVQVCPTPPATTPACHPLLSEANTRIVGDATSSAITVMRQAPDGWKPTLDAALTQISSKLDAAGKQELAAYLDAARAIVNSF